MDYLKVKCQNTYQFFDMMPSPGHVPTAVMQGPSFSNDHLVHKVAKDPWGVEYKQCGNRIFCNA